MAQARAEAPEAPPPDEPKSLIAAAAARFIRRDHIPADYSPWRHMALTLAIAGVIATIGGLLARRARPIDWVLMPIFFVVANLMEWTVHRFPMHRPLQPRIMYRNHAMLHHIRAQNIQGFRQIRPIDLFCDWNAGKRNSESKIRGHHEVLLHQIRSR